MKHSELITVIPQEDLLFNHIKCGEKRERLGVKKDAYHLACHLAKRRRRKVYQEKMHEYEGFLLRKSQMILMHAKKAVSLGNNYFTLHGVKYQLQFDLDKKTLLYDVIVVAVDFNLRTTSGYSFAFWSERLWKETILRSYTVCAFEWKP